ncbi:MAG: sigma-70 family RNA polymerase sigma factor [Gemmatimonadaceae bacterium]
MPITPTDVAAQSSASPSAAGAARHAGDPRHAVTELLRAWGAGDVQASESLVRLVYAELRRQAELALRREQGHTLQPTALVHEAWLRLGDQQDARWESRTQFFAIAAQMMRRVLLDHARARHALKRGGGVVQVSLGDRDFSIAQSDAALGGGAPIDPVDVMALDDALVRLAVMDPQKARLVELRYFAGLSIPETAAALGVSTATVGREWAIARMWLRRELES